MSRSHWGCQHLLLYRDIGAYPRLDCSRLEAELREYARYLTLATGSNSTPRGIATLVAAGLTAIQAARCGVRGAAPLTVRAAPRTSITQAITAFANWISGNPAA